MISVQILSALYNEQSRNIEVVKEITNDDGSVELNIHTIPNDAIEWRAAIYGYTDPIEIAKMILFEPFIELVAPFELTEIVAKEQYSDRTGAAITEFERKPTRAGSRTIMDSFDIDEKYKLAADRDPIDVIVNSSLFNTDVINEKRKYMMSERKNYVKFEETESTTKDRVSMIRKQVNPDRHDTQDSLSNGTLPNGTLPPIKLNNNRRVGK